MAVKWVSVPNRNTRSAERRRLYRFDGPPVQARLRAGARQDFFNLKLEVIVF
jgi:hypothetical protein